MTIATSSPTANRKQNRPSRTQAGFAFGIVLLINILNYMDRTILPAVLPHLQKDFQLSNTEAGLLGSSFLLIYAIAALPLGMWADRGVRKNIVAICAGIWSIATALAGFTQNFIQLFITRAVLGIGEAGYAPASLSLIGDLFPKEQRGRILSIWAISNLIGTALGLTLGGIVADKLGWRWAFYMVGIPGLIAAFFIWRAHEPPRGVFDRSEDEAEEQTEQSIGEHTASRPKNITQWAADLGRTLRHFLHIPTYWVLLVAFIFSFFITGAAQFWIPVYLTKAFQLSAAQAGSLAGGTLAGGSLLGALIGGWLADMLQQRRPQGRMLVSMSAFLLGAPLTLIALSLHQLIPFIIIFAFAIISLSLCLGPLNAIIQDVITPEMRATGLGLILLLAHLFGDVTSTTVIGILADHFTLATALRITAPICLLIAGLVCIIGVRTVAKDMQTMQKTLESKRFTEVKAKNT